MENSLILKLAGKLQPEEANEMAFLRSSRLGESLYFVGFAA
jgi:hypothetical protein